MTGLRARLLLGISILWIPLAFLFDGVTVLLLPVRLGGSATDLGLVSFVGLAVAAGLQPVAGLLSDRFRDRVDRRLFIAVAAAPALGGLWVLAGATGIVAAIVGYVAIQAAAAAVQAGQQTLIPEHVRDDARGRASGLKAAFDVGGAFVAFLVLGAVLATGDLVAAAAVTSAALVVGVVVMVALVPAGGAGPSPARRSLGLPPGLVPLIVARFLFLFATYAVGRFLLLLVSERLAIPADRAADEAGGLLALFTLATALTALAAGWLADRRSRHELMSVGAVTAALGIVVLVPAAGLPGLLVGGLLMSLGTAAFVAANWAATTDLVDASDSGRLMGIANLGTALAAAVAGLVGPLIDHAGFAPALLVAAAASAAATLPLVGFPNRTARSAENLS
jgi:MFS family permease